MDQITNSVLEAIFSADQYISTRKVAVQTGIANEKLIKAVYEIKQHNELFLDIHKNSIDENLLSVRVPEFIRGEVRKFLDNGGFLSIQHNTLLNDQKTQWQEPELAEGILKTNYSHSEDLKKNNTGDILKIAGLLALLTLAGKKIVSILKLRKKS